jgi:hypothetical protein
VVTISALAIAIAIAILTLVIIGYDEFQRRKYATPPIVPVEVDFHEFGKMVVTPRFVDAFSNMAKYHRRYKARLPNDNTMVLGKKIDSLMDLMLDLAHVPMFHKMTDAQKGEEPKKPSSDIKTDPSGQVIPVDFGKNQD